MGGDKGLQVLAYGVDLFGVVSKSHCRVNRLYKLLSRAKTGLHLVQLFAKNLGPPNAIQKALNQQNQFCRCRGIRIFRLDNQRVVAFFALVLLLDQL